MSYLVQISLVAIVVAIACSLPGIFLVLRGSSMVSDAITHTVLLGIVLSYFVTKDLNSPLLIIGATVIGVVTVWLIEWVNKSPLISLDGAIGIVFPFLFSVAIILLTQFASDTHLDVDVVLMGELGFIPFNRVIMFGYDFGPAALWRMLAILAINLVFIIIFYRQLKLTTFDSNYAKSIGISSTLIHYGLMTLVSLTAVGAYDSVGSVLVVGFMVGPAIVGYMLSNNLIHIIGIAAASAVISSLSGVYLAYQLDTTFAGMIAVTTGLCAVLAILFSPKKGILKKVVR